MEINERLSRKAILEHLISHGIIITDENFYDKAWEYIADLPNDEQVAVMAKIGQFGTSAKSETNFNAYKNKMHTTDTIELQVDKSLNQNIVDEMYERALRACVSRRDAQIYSMAQGNVSQPQIANHFKLSVRQIYRIIIDVKEKITHSIDQNEAWFKIYLSEINRNAPYKASPQPALPQSLQNARIIVEESLNAETMYNVGEKNPNKIVVKYKENKFILSTRQIMILAKAIVFTDYIQGKDIIDVYIRNNKNGYDSILIVSEIMGKLNASVIDELVNFRKANTGYSLTDAVLVWSNRT